MTVKITAELLPPSGRSLRIGGKEQTLAGFSAEARVGGEAFREWCGQNVAVAAAAVTAAVKIATEGLKTDLRAAVIQGGLGEKLPGAIRSEMFPKQGNSLKAAGWIFTKGRRTKAILEAYDNGAIIRPKGGGGRFLAIPTEAGKGFVGARGASSLSGIKYSAGVKTRIVKIKGRDGIRLVVADLRRGRGKRGGYRVPTAGALKRRDVEEVVLFILVPLAHVKQRLSIDDLGRQWVDRIPALIEDILPKDL